MLPAEGSTVMDDMMDVVCFIVRGQESAGIVTSTGEPQAKFASKKCMGLVNSAFNNEDLKRLSGSLGIGKFEWKIPHLHMLTLTL